MASNGEKKGPSAITIRTARKGDLDQLAALLVRLKRLNAEFDPLLNVRDDADAQAKKILSANLDDPSFVILAAEGSGGPAGTVVGIVRASVRERNFYMPIQEGVILDIYLMPAFRRHGSGTYLLAETTRHLKAKGAEIVTAEFPSQNDIAVKFYGRHGFRAVTSHHAREV